ncbi:MAG: BTAD domain-containing putative transcriptional regulator [Anaerolineae bacterium]|jgi:ATP/maltotriose-dependent transcriptional regulator MalT/DNA-binding SARP family transcriptional activator
MVTDFGRTLIRSKLLVPSPAGLLHRRQVCKMIEQGLEHRLTLVSAPAGYGKTSALVDFAHRIAVPVCWYTTDERDRDLGLFIRYLVGAINERFPSFGGRTLEALASGAGDLFREPTAAVGDLVNEMIDLGTEFVLVLDNYESVDVAFGIREFVHRLLEVLPSNCHLMMGSRVLPDVPVTRLVAKRQLVGLTERDLRFKPGEIRELLKRSDIEVSEAQARAIATNAEGWITGVLLISDLLREDAKAGFDRLTTGVLVDTEKATSQTYGYLASEVLSRQPQDIRWFLYASSVLRDMSSQLCSQALGIDGAYGYLAEAERRNLFVTRFGDEARATYRYHNLFRDFLQGRLQQDEPGRYVDLHRRAGAWFEGDDDVEEAVYHYLAAQLYPEATVLMERVAMEWFTRGRAEALLRWAGALPEEVRGQAPWLSLYQSRVLTDRYDCNGARQALSYAESGFAGRGDTAGVARVYNQRAALDLLEGRYRDTLAEARAALGMLGQDMVPERADALRHVGKAHIRLGRFVKGASELQRALELFRELDNPYDVVNLLQDLTFAFASRGRLDEAAVYLNEALPIARRLGSPGQLAGVLNNLGMLHSESGDYRRALLLYQEGLAVARRGHDARSQANLADGMATIYRDSGIYHSAEAFYEAAWEIARRSRPGQAVEILTARADMYRWQGDDERALALLEQASQLAKDRGLDVEQRGVLAVAQGIVLAEGHEFEKGLELLSNAVSFLEQQGAMRELARGRLLLAKAHLLRGDKVTATAELRRAMALAEEIGTVQFAVVEGLHAEELVELALARGVPGGRSLADGIERLRAFGQELTQDRLEFGDETKRRLEIYGLGVARVVREGRPIPGSAWQAAMAKELFFYILLHGAVERNAIGLVFWPDLPAQKVTSNFHSTLYRVRQAVGSDAVVVEDGRYRLDVDYWFDVDQFDALFERARLLPPYDWQAEELWRRAVQLYHGELLPEVERAWVVVKRRELGDKYIEALVELGLCHEARGALEEAIDRYRQALELDELREDIHRRIMRTYADAGRRSDAIAQYRRFHNILRRELGIEPSRETTRLYQEITGRMAG